MFDDLFDDPARDAAQAAKFRQYLTDQYDDGPETLILTPDAEFADAEQLARFRAEMEALPFDAIAEEDKHDEPRTD